MVSGGSATSTTVANGGSQVTEAGGTTSKTIVAEGGNQEIIGVDYNAAISGNQTVSSGGSTTGTTVFTGGSQTVMTGGNSKDTTVIGGTMQINEGAKITGRTTLNNKAKVILRNDLTKGVAGKYAIENLVSDNNGNDVVIGTGDDSKLYPQVVEKTGKANGILAKAAVAAQSSPVGRTLTINSMNGSANFIFNVNGVDNTSDQLIVKNADNSTENTAQLRLDGKTDVKTLKGLRIANTPDNFLLKGTKNQTVGLYSGESEFLYENGWWQFRQFKPNGVSRLGRSVNALPALQLAHWRNGDLAVGERMTGLRQSDDGTHIWATVHNDNLSVSDVDGKVYTMDVGYDKQLNDKWRLGVTIGHGQGSTSFTQGTGDVHTNMLGMYGSWNDGQKQFVDIVARAGKIANDFDAVNGTGMAKGDYAVWGYGLSAKYGRHYQQGKTVLEPYAKVAYDHLQGTDYTASGINIKQDAANSLCGELGMSVIQQIRKDSSLYLNVALIHEFAGDTGVTGVSNGLVPLHLTNDVKGTWGDITLGYKEKFDKNSSWHLEVGRSGIGNSAVKNNLRYSGGVEFKF